MKYSFTCPACSHVVTVDAMNDDEAASKLMQEGKTHQAQVHANMPPMADDQMMQMVKSGMKKEESQPTPPQQPPQSPPPQAV